VDGKPREMKARTAASEAEGDRTGGQHVGSGGTRLFRPSVA
jgi:hypothetical protein